MVRETRYFITSLDPAKVSPEKLMQHIRGHWQVENCLHFEKDRWWDEDRHWTSRPGLAERLASLANIALTFLERTRPTLKLPLRGYADQLSWNPLKPLKLLGALD